MTWGTANFEESEVDRPGKATSFIYAVHICDIDWSFLVCHIDFSGEKMISFIDGSDIQYFSAKKRTRAMFRSSLCIFFMTVLVIGVVVSIYVLKYTLSPDVGASNAQTIVSVVNAILIQVLNYLYSSVANFLTQTENHRTNTEVRLSLRLFAFLLLTKPWW